MDIIIGENFSSGAGNSMAVILLQHYCNYGCNSVAILFTAQLVLFWLKFTPLGPNTTKKCTTSTPANIETQHIHGELKKHRSPKCRIYTGEKCAQLFLPGDKTPPLWVENHTT